jgi:hypothetical protein
MHSETGTSGQGHSTAWQCMLCGASPEHLIWVWQSFHWLCITWAYCHLQYVCFPFGTNINLEVIESKMESPFQLDTTIAETTLLTLQNDIQLKSRATTEKGRVPGATARGEVYQHKKMCSQRISPFWINLPLWICIFSHEVNKVQVQIYYEYWPPSGPHETCNKLLTALTMKPTCLHPMPKVTLRYEMKWVPLICGKHVIGPNYIWVPNRCHSSRSIISDVLRFIDFVG